MNGVVTNAADWRGMKLKKSIELEKAKESPIGTTSTHGGKKVKKTAEGWVPVGSGKKGAAKDPETTRGSAAGYGIHNIEAGDQLQFRTKDGGSSSGRVTSADSKNAIVITPEGRQFEVPYEHITKFKGKGKRSPVDSGKPLGDIPIPPADFVANEWAAHFDDPNVTAESILAETENTNPSIREAVSHAEDRLRGIEQTIARHRIAGEGLTAEYTAERKKKHEEISRHFLTEDILVNAKPPEGQKPVLIMLGGRGGSGKSWFNGQVYDPEKTVVLDADEIKGMLDEYEGWNAFQVHEESSDILEMIKERAMDKGLNVVIDATLKTPKSAIENSDMFKSAGYDLEVHYMHAPRKIAAQRAMSRFTGKSGRYVPIAVILGNVKNEESFELLKKEATTWSFRDSTGGPPPKVVSEMGKGRFMKSVQRFLWDLVKSEKSSPAPKDEKDSTWAYDFYDFRPVNPNAKPSSWLKGLMAEDAEIIAKKNVKKSRDNGTLDKSRAGTKYIRKYWKNGKWNYIYPENGATRRPRPVPEHIEVKNLGGTTGGAMLIELPNGEKKVLKYSTGPEHLKEEYVANRIYDILGVPVPSVQLREGPGGLAQIADFVRGTPMGDLSGLERNQAIESLKQGFVADALLGNWDVLGMDGDNVLWDGARAWRIDNGGSLRYRAQGQPKGDKFGTRVGELETMRDPDRGAGKRAFSIVTDEDVDSQIRTVVARKQTILGSIDNLSLRRTIESRINDLERRVDTQKSVKVLSDSPLLVKSYDGAWHLVERGFATRFHWFHGLEQFTKSKTYYSPEEVKARGMRWVTIRGARVLLQGTSDGGYVVVGGAGGKLNHLKVDRVLGKEDYDTKRKQVDKKRKEELRSLTKEEIAEHAQQRKAEVSAKKEARTQYTSKVTGILGVTQDDLRSQITASEMDELTDKARKMVEIKMTKKTIADPEAEIEKTAEELAKKEAAKKVKDIERAALETLMNDYMPEDPNAKPELKKLLDKDKATEILMARKEFRKTIKEIGKGQVDIPTKLKVGEIFAGNASNLPGEIEEEIRQQIETQKNIKLYDRMNAQSMSIQKHVDQGAISAMNGLIGDIYGSGATFSTDTIENLGLEAVVRAVTIKIQQDGKGEVVRKALEEYASTERQKVVDRATEEYDRRMSNADNLRDLARDTDDSESILSMASANGHALKQITAAQRALGSAVGSLRAVSHMINALEDPPADVVQVDIGKDLSRARAKAKDAGLPKGSYSIKTLKDGRSKRLVLELQKDQLDTFFSRNEQLRKDESTVAKIKRHEMNDGYKPPGVKENIKFDAAQEAGIRFFMEKGQVILDFEAGLGKTGVAYGAIAEAMNNKGAKKVLVVTPAKTRGDFKDHAKKFLEKDLASQVRSSTENTSKKDRHDRHNQEGIHIISQDALREDAEFIKSAGYDMIVVDEIHEMTAGTGQAGRFKGLMDIADVPLKIAMSGTNIKNKKEELYRKINFIDPDHTLGSMTEFKKRYEGLNQGTGMFADAANDAFRKEIAEWVYTQKNVLPIDNKAETHRVPLTPTQRRKYAESERLYRKQQAEGVPGAAARRDVRNYEVVTSGDTADNSKMNKLVDIMNSSHAGEKAVIHVSRPGSPVLKAIKSSVGRLEREYGKGTVGVIEGDSSPGYVSNLKKRFNDPNDPLRFIVGSKSLESGHNLQHGGTVTFHLDIPDSYAAFQQRNARVFRKGQDRDTNSYVLSGLNPFDMRGEDMMETKRKEQGILGNPRSVDSMDDTGFIGILNRYDREATGGKDE